MHYGDTMEGHVVGQGNYAPRHGPNLLHRVRRDGNGQGVAGNCPLQRHSVIRRSVIRRSLPAGKPVIQGQRRPIGVASAVQSDDDPALAPSQQDLHQLQLALGKMAGQIVDDCRLPARRPVVGQGLRCQPGQFVPGVAALPSQQGAEFAVQLGQVQAGQVPASLARRAIRGGNVGTVKGRPLLPLAESAGQFGVQPASSRRRERETVGGQPLVGDPTHGLGFVQAVQWPALGRAVIPGRTKHGPGQLCRQTLPRLGRHVEHVARAQQVAHRAGHVTMGGDDNHAGKGIVAIGRLRGGNGGGKGPPGGLADLGKGDARHGGSGRTISLYQFPASFVTMIEWESRGAKGR